MNQSNFHRVVFSQGDALVTVKRVGQFREVTASRGQQHIGTWLALTSGRRAQCIGWAIEHAKESLGDVGSNASDPRSTALPLPNAQAPAEGQTPSIAIAKA